MVQYRDLNAPPPRMLADVVADMKASERQSKTGDAGVKDLGESGDVVWPRPDGTPVSVRDVDLDLADARQRIEDAEGDLAGAQARIDTALDAEGHIREDEILRNATLLGETVVEQINVTDKLVGTDGVFTGTVDFANVNVTGELLANEISGEHIYGTVIEGGEVRTGTDETRGKFLLGDSAYVNPTDGYATPGLRFTPPNSTHVHQPALGVIGGGIRVSGGKSATGALSTLSAHPGGVSASATAPVGSTERRSTLDVGGTTGARMTSNMSDDSENASIVADLSFNYSGGSIPPRAQLLATSGNQRGEVVAYGDGRAWLSTGGTTPRSLRVDTAGVWATEGSNQVSLIPQVRPFQYSALWNMDLSPSPILVQHLPGGKLCQAQARIQNLTGSSFSLPYNNWVTLNLNPIPSDLRGGYTDYIEIRLPQADGRGVLEMNYSTGSIRIRNLHRNDQGGIDLAWSNNSSIWFPMRWFVPN